jgi:hypothetical protein
VDLEYTLVNGTLTKSIGVNEDGETEITVEMSGSNATHGFGTGSNTGGMMNQTIVIEAKPLESVEAFGVKASSSNIVFAVLAVIVIIACWRLLKKWY